VKREIEAARKREIEEAKKAAAAAKQQKPKQATPSLQQSASRTKIVYPRP
jgi:hypothetical protein